jgi:hypothetical protein
VNGMPVLSFGQDVLGWIVVAAGTIATIATIAAAVVWTVRPGEREPSHPKYAILRPDR